MSSLRFSRRVAPSFTLSVCAAFATAQGDLPNHPEDPRSIVVQVVAEATPERVHDVLGAVGIEVAESQAFGRPGSRLVELSGPASASARRSLAAALAGRPDVAYASPVWRGTDGLPAYPVPEILLAFDADTPPEVRHALLGGVPGVSVLEERYAGLEHAWKLACDTKLGHEVIATAARVAALPGVLWAEPNVHMRITTHGAASPGAPLFLPDDPHFPLQWGLRNTGGSYCSEPVAVDRDMNVDLAWDVTTGNGAVIVAVLDNGVELSHPDLNVLAGANFTTATSFFGEPAFNGEAHGTQMAGCISAHVDNGLGVAGVAPECYVVPVKVYIGDPATQFEFDWLVNGLNFALGYGARVTSSSFSLGVQSSAVDAAYQSTHDAGLTHFVSAGNFNQDVILYPSNLPSVLAVSGANPVGATHTNYNHGPGLFCTAPGRCVWTTDRTGSNGSDPSDYANINGSSPACASAAGVAALVLARAPQLPVDDLEGILAGTARNWTTPGGYNDYVGWGMPDARAALDRLAADYVFVDAAAPPGGDGSGAFPFQTVSQGVASAGSGDTVYVAGATYTETLTETTAMEVLKLPGGGDVVVR